MYPSPRAASLLLAVLALSRSAVAGVCVVSASSINFGSYNPLAGAPTRSVGTVTYRCRSRPPAGIKILLAGAAPGAAGIRYMTAGSGERLPYLLCLDSQCVQPWGDGSNGTTFYYDVKPPVGTAVTINLFGLMPERQGAKANRVYQTRVTVLAEF